MSIVKLNGKKYDKHQNSDSNNTNNRLTQSLTTSDNISS
jgi:hypothetical protein